MALLQNPVPWYLDQNVLSELREGGSERRDLKRLLEMAAEKNAVIVYSMTHVEECRASRQPERFAQVLEELSAYLLKSTSRSDQSTTLLPGRARELIFAEPEVADCLTSAPVGQI